MARTRNRRFLESLILDTPIPAGDLDHGTILVAGPFQPSRCLSCSQPAEGDAGHPEQLSAAEPQSREDLKDQRAALLNEVKALCRQAGIPFKDEIVAMKASPTWTTRDLVGKWKRVNSDSKQDHDKRIRRALNEIRDEAIRALRQQGRAPRFSGTRR